MGRYLPLVALAGLALAIAAGAQQTSVPYTFQSNTRLVIETVTVTGPDGKPVTSLTARDFTLTEDGRPQKLAFFDFQTIQDVGIPPLATTGPWPRALGPVERKAGRAARPRGVPRQSMPGVGPALPPLTTFQIAPEAPGHPRYRGRRLIALYFDLFSMPVADRLRSLDAAHRFVVREMKPADMIAILDYQGAGVRVEQDFTADRGALDAAIEKLYTEASLTALGVSEDIGDAGSADTGTAFGQDDTAFNIFHDDRELAALETAVEMLAPLSERKSLVYFASGLRLHETDNEAQLEATIDAALKANVNLYPVDAQGLTAGVPMGDATQGSPGGVSMYNGSAALAYNLRRQQSQDALYALGHDTGGKALLDSNNLAAGIALAQNAIVGYYILGYYTSDAALDGKYRRVEVKLAGHPGVRLDYRAGYYAGKVFAKFTAADKERQLEDALLLGDPITDLTIGAAINSFQMNSAEYFVPVTVKIPGGELGLKKKGSGGQLTMDFIGEVKDVYGLTIANLRDKVQIKLPRLTAAELARAPLEYNTGFTLLPGQYVLKLLARDSITGRIGTYLTHFTVPNLEAVQDRLPVSSVVLSRRRVPVAAALFNAKQKRLAHGGDAGSPLVSDGAELIPSVNRVFRRGDQMDVYLQAYEHGPEAENRRQGSGGSAIARLVPQPLVAYIAFYRNHVKVFESAPQIVRAKPKGRAGAIPISFAVPLSGLAPGRYTCQVTVLDPTGQKANFWRGDIAVVR